MWAGSGRVPVFHCLSPEPPTPALPVFNRVLPLSHPGASVICLWPVLPVLQCLAEPSGETKPVQQPKSGVMPP